MAYRCAWQVMFLAGFVWLSVCGSGSAQAQHRPAETDHNAVTQRSTPHEPQHSTLGQPHPLDARPIPVSARDRLALHFVDRGQHALDREDYQRARRFFERAIEIAPLRAEGYYFLGSIDFALGRPEQALAFLLKAEVCLADDNREWLGRTACLQGAIHEDRRDYIQARRSYQRCLKFSPENLRAISALARLPHDGRTDEQEERRR